eukprot:194921_1
MDNYLSKLLMFREMTDKLTTTEFNLFKKHICDQMNRATFLQTIFHGLYKQKNAKNIDDALDIVEQIIDSRGPNLSSLSDTKLQTQNQEEKKQKSTTICNLSAAVIQYIATYLSLQNLFNFEKTNRFIAYTLKSQSCVKYILNNDYQIFNQWLGQAFPIQKSLRYSIGDEEFVFNVSHAQYLSTFHQLQRFKNVQQLCCVINDKDESTYFGQAGLYIQKRLQDDEEDRYDGIVEEYLKHTLVAVLNTFKRITHLDLSYNISFREYWRSLAVISNNSLTLKKMIFRDHHPAKMIDCFSSIDRTNFLFSTESHITAFPELQHFSLININTSYPYNIRYDLADIEEPNEFSDWDISNPFKRVNRFLMHLLPNVNLFHNEMYPLFNSWFIPKPDPNYTETQYSQNIHIPQSTQVKGYQYLTIDNSDLNFSKNSFYRDYNLSNKLLKLLQNVKMVEKSFKQIKGICALNLRPHRTNLYYLIKSILAVHSNKIRSLHIHNVINVYIPHGNVEELCSDFDFTKQNCIAKFTKLKRLQMNIVYANKERISKYEKTLKTLFDSNVSLKYIGLNLSLKYNSTEFANVIQMFEKIFEAGTAVRNAMKIRISIICERTFRDLNVIVCDGAIQKLMGSMERISNKNCMLLFTFIKDKQGICTKIDDLSNGVANVQRIHGNNFTRGSRSKLSVSFGLSGSNCKMNGYVEHWDLNCKVCEHVKHFICSSQEK